MKVPLNSLVKCKKISSVQNIQPQAPGFDQAAENEYVDLCTAIFKFQKVHRNPFVGANVLVRSSTNGDIASRTAKGSYGYVVSVCEEKRNAEVFYLGKSGTFPLMNLVSVYVFDSRYFRP